jgi:hypothetical protein
MRLHGFELFPLDGIPPFASVLDRDYELVPDFAAVCATSSGFRVYKRRSVSRQK